MTGDTSPLTTKGDVYTFDTAGARLAVGADDLSLTADSSEATGLAWVAHLPLAGGTMAGPIDMGGFDIKAVKVYSLDNNLTIDAMNSGAASQDIYIRADDTTGTRRVRVYIGGAGDTYFYKVDGTTISLAWDESDDRWEFTTNVSMGGYDIVNAQTIAANNAVDLDLKGGVTSVLRMRIDGGTNDIIFYDSTPTATLLWDESDSRWEFATDVDLGGHDITGANDIVANTSQSLIFRDDTVATRVRIYPNATGDMKFYDPNGTTVTLQWDDSDGRWEFGGAVGVVLPVKTDTGDPSSPAEGQLIVNTFDNNVQVYADGAWRTLASW